MSQSEQAASARKQNRLATPKRQLEGIWKQIVWAAGLAMALAHIYFLVIHPVNPWVLYCCHFGFGYSLILATRCAHAGASKTSIPFYDLCLIALNIGIALYIVNNVEGIVARSGVDPTPIERVIFPLLTLIVLEVARRVIGPTLPMIAGIALLYARFGRYMPGLLAHRGQRWDKIFSYLCSTDGIFSTPFNASATMVFLFIVFGAFLQACGSGQYFIDLSLSTAGSTRGGPAKVAVLASALFGTVSGNSTANVVSTGTLTIPLMQSIGYKPYFAGAAEAVASTGGQFMPPVLGSAAFIMAQLIGVSYAKIVAASVIPALLYFATVFVMVDLEALKNHLIGLPREQLPPLGGVLKRAYLAVPLIVLIFVLSFFNWSAVRSAMLGIGVCIAVSWFGRDSRITPKKVINALSAGAISSTSIIASCGTAGVVIGMLNLTGGGLKFAGAIIEASHGQLPIALILTMLACLIMGMGLPTAASYLICAAVTVPTLVQMGLSPLTSHMFIFFFACISAFTPPVCTAAYAAAGIAGASPMKVAITACKIGCTAFIIPFMFAYGPSLLWQGDTLTVLITMATALAGCMLISFGMQRMVFSYSANWLESILLIAASLCLITPGVTSDVIGLVLGAAAIFSVVKIRRKS